MQTTNPWGIEVLLKKQGLCQESEAATINNYTVGDWNSQLSLTFFIYYLTSTFVIDFNNPFDPATAHPTSPTIFSLKLSYPTSPNLTSLHLAPNPTQPHSISSNLTQPYQTSLNLRKAHQTFTNLTQMESPNLSHPHPTSPTLFSTSPTHPHPASPTWHILTHPQIFSLSTIKLYPTSINLIQIQLTSPNIKLLPTSPHIF